MYMRTQRIRGAGQRGWDGQREDKGEEREKGEKEGWRGQWE